LNLSEVAHLENFRT